LEVASFSAENALRLGAYAPPAYLQNKEYLAFLILLQLARIKINPQRESQIARVRTFAACCEDATAAKACALAI
jgi:hypothetical protein